MDEQPQTAENAEQKTPEPPPPQASFYPYDEHESVTVRSAMGEITNAYANQALLHEQVTKLEDQIRGWQQRVALSSARIEGVADAKMRRNRLTGQWTPAPDGSGIRRA